MEIDRCFNVKGVGQSLLGVVTRGTLRKHDKLAEAGQGSRRKVDTVPGRGRRVGGPGLKGRNRGQGDIGEDDVKKGDVLSTTLIPGRTSLEITIKISKVANEQPKPGNQYQIFTGFNSCSCIIER